MGDAGETGGDERDCEAFVGRETSYVDSFGVYLHCIKWIKYSWYFEV